MADFWDLQAVVGGVCKDGGNFTGSYMDQHQPFCGSLSDVELNELCLNFPDIFETPRYFDELEKFYKPFYPSMESFCSESRFNCSMEVVANKEPQKLQNGSQVTPVTASSSHAAKFKKSRKSQNKTLVKQVSADGTLASDMWAWRKYGQKPIKGSPHPRSYYRCSSSKGCSARKLVERSNSDPGIFIITYTAEHNHTLPTRRNSLAGSTRNKFPKGSNTAETEIKAKDGYSPATNPLKGNENVAAGEIFVGDLVLRENLCSSLDEFGELCTPENCWSVDKPTSVEDC